MGSSANYDTRTGNSNNYDAGHWGKGNFDIKELAERYGLDTSNPGRTEHDIYGKDADGNEVYIGRSNMGMASNKDLIRAHSNQAHPDEGDHFAEGSNLSSSGDIRGAILNQWNRGAAAKAEPEPEPEPDLVLEESTQKYKDTRLDLPENAQPEFGYSDDVYKDAISHGDDLNKHYARKFLPSLEAEAKLTAHEIGRSGLKHMQNMKGTVGGQLGDGKDLFEYYANYLNDAYDA
jgi:hypothetical protein